MHEQTVVTGDAVCVCVCVCVCVTSVKHNIYIIFIISHVPNFLIIYERPLPNGTNL
jgi:hypothetical protein